MERSRSTYYIAREYQVNPENRGKRGKEKERKKKICIIFSGQVSDQSH